jgi:hypothetical protein
MRECASLGPGIAGAGLRGQIGTVVLVWAVDVKLRQMHKALYSFSVPVPVGLSASAMVSFLQCTNHGRPPESAAQGCACLFTSNTL